MISEQLNSAFAKVGLSLRGGFSFSASDNTPHGLSGHPARSVLLVGNAGAAYWPHFRRWLSEQPAPIQNPLDTWCRQVIGDIAEQVGARAVSPADKPFLPFQQWAMRAEGLRASPLGILMHPDYGVWHAYRGALLFDVEVPIQMSRTLNHRCDLCASKPCKKHCPVAAHAGEGFAYADCLSHVRSPAGLICREQGCLDRNACPQGTEFRYPTEVQRFHMDAFAG
ncbi:hypothetical protein QBK99_11690 [Corticibacterium sp. UT-5YL-CI-8]|nr:hypothetical protein [Tianweitania sp. UT-5YL-CI-8]